MKTILTKGRDRVTVTTKDDRLYVTFSDDDGTGKYRVYQRVNEPDMYGDYALLYVDSLIKRGYTVQR